MTIKTAIFTANIGGGSDCLPAMLSAQWYAGRHGIDYFVCEEPAIRFLYPPFEKHQCFRLFDMGYDRVLILDRDILVAPDTPNIFESHPDMDTLYAFDESMPDETMNRDPIVSGIKGELQWPRNERGTYKYFNSGVVIISRNFKDFTSGFRDLPETRSMRRFPEQTSMNYLAIKRGVRFESLEQHWNRMDMGIPDPGNRRYGSHFIHYAGDMAFMPDEAKSQTLRRDFVHFYGEEALAAGAVGLSYQTLATESKEPLDKSSKECSIFLLCDPESAEVNSYLGQLSAQYLPADYELLVTEDCLKSVETGYMEALREPLRTVEVMERLGFEQSCVDIARQAWGRFVVFVKQPSSWSEIAETVRRLDTDRTNIAVCGGGAFIAVNRDAFMKARSFNDLLSKSGCG